MDRRVIAVFLLVLLFFVTACAHFDTSDTGERRASVVPFSPSAAIPQPGWVQISGPASYYGLDTRQAMLDFASILNIDYDFLQENDDLTALAYQWARLRDYVYNNAPMRTVRRGFIVDPSVSVIGPPIPGAELFFIQCESFWNSLGMETEFPGCRNMEHPWLISALRDFAGLCRSSTRAQVVEELAMGMFPTRNDLPPCQQQFYEALEAFMHTVNAPFWDDMQNNDPVITRIGLPGIVNCWDVCYFTIWLYDPDLLELSEEELAQHTDDLRAAITEFTGISNQPFVFRVAW